MNNKLSITRQCITISTPRGDTATTDALRAAGVEPIHSNRILTTHKVSGRFLPEVLAALRGYSVDNPDTQLPAPVESLLLLEMRSRVTTECLINSGPTQSGYVNQNLTLDTHQQLGRELALATPRYAFFYDTRTGKTPMSLTIIYDDLLKHPEHKWLVVCPLILIENAWLEDAEKFFPEMSIINTHASTKKKRLKLINTKASVYVTNTESFASYVSEFEPIGFYGAIIDESSSMKSPSTATSNALVKFSWTLPSVYLLSGTPAPNGKYEYYAQLKAVDPFCVPSSYAQFSAKYFNDISKDRTYKKLVIKNSDADEALMRVIKSVSLYVDKEDALETPGRTFHEVVFTMPDDVASHYRLMKNKLYTTVVNGDEEITLLAPSAAAKLNKLNQISSGFIIDTEAVQEKNGRPTWHLLDSFRFECLFDLLRSQGLRFEQVLIWANYRAEFEVIKSALGDSCRCVNGASSPADKNEAIKLFKAGQIQYLVANQASADKGLTLTNAHIAVYFSLNWSYELYKQSMERIYGSIRSQPKHCHYYILIADNTIDGILYREVLQGKQEASQAVLNHLKGGLVHER